MSDPPVDPGDPPGINSQTQNASVSVSADPLVNATESRKTIILKKIDDLLYPDNSTGPFVISLSYDGLGNKHATLIGEALYRCNIVGIKSIKKINKSLVNIEFVKRDYANNLVSNHKTILPYENARVFIPLNYITRRLVINDVHTDLGIESIGNYLKDKYANVISVRRIFRRNEKGVLTPTPKLELLWEGTTRPDFFYIFYSRCKATPYIYNVTTCSNCLNYGHRAEFKGILTCKGLNRCPNCSDQHAAHDICPNSTKCLHCKGPHKTFDPSCPSLLEQKAIKKIMAFENLSFHEATKKLEMLKTENIKLTLNDRLLAIQNKIKAGETISIDDIDPKNFPVLNNKYLVLTSNNDQEQTSPDNFQYSIDDLRRPYSEVVLSPSPIRKKVKISEVNDPVMPSDRWLKNYQIQSSSTQIHKPISDQNKGFWPVPNKGNQTIVSQSHLGQQQLKLAPPPSNKNSSYSNSSTIPTKQTPSARSPVQPPNTGQKQAPQQQYKPSSSTKSITPTNLQTKKTNPSQSTINTPSPTLTHSSEPVSSLVLMDIGSETTLSP
ncbi:uncharacterized protein [Bemisia tabaci]|uniref:uncharacterized protein n=1 Tax=Bemisia tabaci TaxID=7038 RepID=UPI003B28C10D